MLSEKVLVFDVNKQCKEPVNITVFVPKLYYLYMPKH